MPGSVSDGKPSGKGYQSFGLDNEAHCKMEASGSGQWVLYFISCNLRWFSPAASQYMLPFLHHRNQGKPARYALFVIREREGDRDVEVMRFECVEQGR